ncbi:MAG: hypothetical protein RI973_1992 [Bacteroidota bacterium]|jgi:hypothetical protein
MQPDILFSEKQYFRQTWIWLIMAPVNLLFLFGLVRQLGYGKTFGDKPMSDQELIVATVLSFLPMLLILLLKLETVIRRDGIYYRFVPFQWTFRKITWESTEKIYVRKYNPLREYGGWGLRTGLSGKNGAFNVSGDQGLQIEFNNGRKFLIGTKKPKELAEALQGLGQYRP